MTSEELLSPSGLNQQVRGKLINSPSGNFSIDNLLKSEATSSHKLPSHQDHQNAQADHSSRSPLSQGTAVNLI